ncbi:MAG: Flp pilus assembly protein CpaB [Thermogutta sp.]|nr:Flp pilus assembly protein CpaB [Thermogutta sp.]
MRTKSMILLAVAMGCGVVAAIGVKQVLATRDRVVAAPAEETQAILVAMEDIPMGELINEKQIKLEDWPKSKIPAGAIFDLSGIEDRRTKTRIFKGSPILDGYLLAKGAVDAGAAPWIPKGYRVVSVKVDPVSGSSAMIRPGDRVDVVVHFSANPARGIVKNFTRTVLQNIKVFAIDDKYELTDEEQKAFNPKTVSLLVTPEQAEVLTAASELGQIRLVMRGLGDVEPAETKGVEPSQLLGLPTGEGDPDKEMLPGQGPRGQDDQDDFARFLASVRQSQAPQADPGAEMWPVRIISGANVDDVILEEEQSQGTAGPVPARWRVVSSGRNGDGSNAAADAVPSDLPPPPPPEPEPDPVEPQADEPSNQ